MLTQMNLSLKNMWKIPKVKEMWKRNKKKTSMCKAIKNT